MDYSCHGRYKGIQLVFGLFSLLSFAMLYKNKTSGSVHGAVLRKGSSSGGLSKVMLFRCLGMFFPGRPIRVFHPRPPLDYL